MELCGFEPQSAMPPFVGLASRRIPSSPKLVALYTSESKPVASVNLSDRFSNLGGGCEIRTHDLRGMNPAT